MGRPLAGRGSSDEDPDFSRPDVDDVAWLNREALEKSMETGQMHYWSRSRGKLWLKGETSGHTQKIVRWFHDCDRDVLLFEVEQVGGACHTGYRSCFFQELDREAKPLAIRETKAFDDGAVYAG